MYADKPMQGHGLMQAIARVNRVFRDKQGGLVVDYLDELVHHLNVVWRGRAVVPSEVDSRLPQQLPTLFREVRLPHIVIAGRKCRGTPPEMASKCSIALIWGGGHPAGRLLHGGGAF
jgi:hypothetical protein